MEALTIVTTPYGLQTCILTSNLHRAHALATRIDAGRALINTLPHEARAHEQSGIGRDYGTFGFEALLEPKSVLV